MTYLCEKTFSPMEEIKLKYCNCLQLESDLRVAVSTIQLRMSHLVWNMQAHPSHWVSTVSHFYTLTVSMFSIGEDHMISLGGHGENRGSNLRGNIYIIYVYFHLQQYQKMPPVSLPMIINVKQCMVCEIFFVLQWWRQKKSLGTTAVEHHN
jgi:hypothetical protein